MIIPPPTTKKRSRPPTARPAAVFSPTTAALLDAYPPDCSIAEAAQKLRRTSSHSALSPSSRPALSFFDPSTADVILRIVTEPEDDDDDEDEDDVEGTVQIHLHSWALERSKYFAALLSSRWKADRQVLKLPISPSRGSVENYLTVLKLMYSEEEELGFLIGSASAALDVLPAALHLLFEDLVRFCLTFLEAVPWTQEEETRVLEVVPLLELAESDPLLARISPRGGAGAPSEDMLEGLISQVIHNYPNAAYAKNFVAILLRDLSSRDSARAVLERAFGESLRHVRESLEEYSSPDFRGHHDETEAKQRANLQTLLSNGRHLCWLIERMVELKVADKAVSEWSAQPGFTADLQRAFRDDAWRNIVPGLPAVMLRCTGKIAAAVASGAILAATQVRMQLVKYWLPVLAVCRDNVSPMFPVHKTLYSELEQIFLKIISTLPLADAQELLQQCLGFSTRSVDDCKHLMSAFETWFRRAARPPLGDNLH